MKKASKPFGNIKKGALHKELGIAQGQPLPVTLLHGALHGHPDETTRKRIQFALNARRFHHGKKGK